MDRRGSGLPIWVAMALLTLSGCASFGAHPRKDRASVPIVVVPLGERCPPNQWCAPKQTSAHRQYFDQKRRRYYFYDPVKRRYFWENGEAKS